MFTTIFPLRNGNRFGFSCPEDIIPKWSERTRHVFNRDFKTKCLALLCIQKYSCRNIDKNIFFLLMQKILKGNYYLLPDKKLYHFLYYIKEIEIEQVFKKVKLNTIIAGKSFQINHLKEYFPVLYSYKNYPLEVLKRDKVIGIMEIDEYQINYHVLRNDKINKLTLNLSFNFFKDKKKQRQLYDLLNYNFFNIVTNHNYKVKKYRFLIFIAIAIILFFLYILLGKKIWI
jgi:DNA-directed RNA polymerase subunit N (RpoN/RPB10)